MFFSQFVCGAKPSKSGTSRLFDDTKEPLDTKTEEAPHLHANSVHVDKDRPRIPLMTDPLTMRISTLDHEGRRVLPSWKNTSAPSAVVPSLPAGAETLPGLRYPVERYLPPAGPYYEQCTLSTALGHTFDRNKTWCSSCWRAGHGPSEDCSRACWICSSQNHLGIICPLLYCSHDWYKYRRSLLVNSSVHIRPSLAERDTLSQLGVIQPATVFEDPIIPLMSHPICKKFYENSPGPMLISRRVPVHSSGFDAHLTPITICTAFIENSQSAEGTIEAAHHSGYNSAGFDSHHLGNAPTMSVEPGQPLNLGCTTDRPDAWEDTVRELEAKVLDLEAEWLALKVNSIDKDRNLKGLEKNNKTLRGGEGDSKLRGIKRQRLW